jgi:hypothetical protein
MQKGPTKDAKKTSKDYKACIKDQQDYKGCKKDQEGLQRMEKGPTRITKDAERTIKDYNHHSKPHVVLENDLWSSCNPNVESKCVE